MKEKRWSGSGGREKEGWLGSWPVKEKQMRWEKGCQCGDKWDSLPPQILRMLCLCLFYCQFHSLHSHGCSNLKMPLLFWFFLRSYKSLDFYNLSPSPYLMPFRAETTPLKSIYDPSLKIVNDKSRTGTITIWQNIFHAKVDQFLSKMHNSTTKQPNDQGGTKLLQKDETCDMHEWALGTVPPGLGKCKREEFIPLLSGPCTFLGSSFLR